MQTNCPPTSSSTRCGPSRYPRRSMKSGSTATTPTPAKRSTCPSTSNASGSSKTATSTARPRPSGSVPPMPVPHSPGASRGTTPTSGLTVRRRSTTPTTMISTARAGTGATTRMHTTILIICVRHRNPHRFPPLPSPLATTSPDTRQRPHPMAKSAMNTSRPTLRAISRQAVPRPS